MPSCGSVRVREAPGRTDPGLPESRQPMRARSKVLVTAFFAAWLDAAVAIMAGEPPDSASSRVDANLPSSYWTSAVSVTVNGKVYSGVVVAPGFVLTASHVTGGAAPAAISVQINAQPTAVVSAVTAVTTFPGASFPYDDLALLTLATPVTSEVRIPPILTQAPSPHDPLWLVGYGASGPGNAGPSTAGSASVKRTALNHLDAVQTTVDASGRTSLFYFFDFDGPTGSGALGGGSLGNGLEGGLASGDSGSPAFVDIGGQRWLAGINTFVAPTPGSAAVDYRFGTIGGGMLLSDPRFVSWLSLQTQGTATLPPAESEDIPVPSWSLGALGLLLSANLLGLRAGSLAARVRGLRTRAVPPRPDA